MPKFNSREEYEAWKAQKLRESGIDPEQQKKQEPPPPPPRQPRKPAAQRPQQGQPAQGARPAQRPQQRLGTETPGPAAQAAAAQGTAPVAKTASEPSEGPAFSTKEEIARRSPWLRTAGYLEEEEVDTRSYMERVPEAFAYPFAGTGKYILVGGVIMMILADFFAIGLLGLVLAIIVFGYLGSYMMKIINSSSDGKKEPPDWPAFSDFGDDIFSPALQLFWTGLVSYFPAIGIRIYLWPIEGLGDAFTLLGIDLVCSFYFPMALVVLAHTRAYLSVLPHIVLPSIFRVPVDYMIAVFVYQIVVIVNNLLERALSYIPLLGSVVTSFLSLYLLMAVMHLLGLVYYKNKETLNWYGEYS